MELLKACRKKKSDTALGIIKFSQDMKIDPDDMMEYDENGDDSLMLAIKNNMWNVVEQLIKFDMYDPNHVNNLDQTHLILACSTDFSKYTNVKKYTVVMLINKMSMKANIKEKNIMHVSNTIEVSNLTDDIKKNDMDNLFYKYGQIVRIKKNKSGYLVSFQNKRGACDAIKGLRGRTLDGKLLKLKFNT